jgi:hypothetical protein
LRRRPSLAVGSEGLGYKRGDDEGLSETSEAFKKEEAGAATTPSLLLLVSIQPSAGKECSQKFALTEFSEVRLPVKTLFPRSVSARFSTSKQWVGLYYVPTRAVAS